MADTRIEVKVDGDDVDAHKMLNTALSLLRLLKALEKEKYGKGSRILWRVDMMSGLSYGLIALRATGAKGGTEKIEVEAMEIIKRFKQEQEKAKA